MNLTDEQIEAAAKAMFESSWPKNEGKWPAQGHDGRERWRELARIAAPFLQMPWKMPTEEESDSIYSEVSRRDAFSIPAATRIKAAMQLFVRYRNASLIPKPLDPRREKVLKVLSRGICVDLRDGSYVAESDKLTDRILAALDAKE